jgi:hypothetical protein
MKYDAAPDPGAAFVFLCYNVEKEVNRMEKMLEKIMEQMNQQFENINQQFKKD